MTRVIAATALMLAFGAGCAVMYPDYPVSHHKGDKYLDPREPSSLDTHQLESADLVTACNDAVGRLLAHHRLSGRFGPPVFVIDSTYFSNHTHDDYDVVGLADLLRNELLNAGGDRIRVVHQPHHGHSAHSAHKPDPELEPHVVVSSAMQADYALGASITEVSRRAGGVTENYTQIAFQAIDMRSQEVVFADLHAFKKASSRTAGKWY